MAMNVATQLPDQVSLQRDRAASPEELAKAQSRREQFQRNLDWLRAHASEVYSTHRGQHICIAGQELFVAGTAQEALQLGRAAHPEDEGIYLRYVPRKKVERIYAH